MDLLDRNRRRHDRIAAHLPVRISTIDPETDPWTGKPFFRSAREWSTNVSRGGIFLRTREPLLPGQRVLVEVDLPGGEAVEAVGRVAWVRRVLQSECDDPKAGVGLQFIGARGEELGVLEGFVEAHTSDEVAA
jgi:uncharacterized protein (TIGR02266 family)